MIQNVGGKRRINHEWSYSRPFGFGPEAVFMHRASLLEKRVVGD